MPFAADAFLQGPEQKGDWKAASKDFDATMRKVLPSDKLEETWKAITSKLGPVKQQLGVRTKEGAKYDFVFLTCRFEKETLDGKSRLLDKEKHLAGFSLQPTKPTEFAAPPYAKKDAFREEEDVVGKGWRLAPCSYTCLCPGETDRSRPLSWCMAPGRMIEMKPLVQTSRSVTWPGDWLRRE